MLELIAELGLNKTLFMFTTLKAGQLRLASSAQPAPLLPSLHFCGSWRERREKLYWEIDCSTYTCASPLHSESG